MKLNMKMWKEAPQQKQRRPHRQRQERVVCESICGRRIVALATGDRISTVVIICNRLVGERTEADAVDLERIGVKSFG